jgi:(p)ppGpp synthase/HD superfamily hydrolase
MSERLHRAIDLAARAHAHQRRKDRDLDIPYVAHVYGVAMLLAAHGFPEEVLIAGLLHDLLEDAPQFAPELEGFGGNVVRWVQTVTDPGKHDANHLQDLPWEERKAGYIEQIRGGDAEAKAVCCADKIHNMESTWMALERGDGFHFSRPVEVQIRYWRRVREAFGAWDHPMLQRYEELLSRLSQHRS